MTYEWTEPGSLPRAVDEVLWMSEQRAGTTVHLAEDLAEWAVGLDPDAEDLELGERALLDTMAVTLAARGHPLVQVAGGLGDAARWASIGHVLDFDDLHLPSTAHVSVVCVPAVLASGGDARAYLAAAGVMARLGTALGWDHYARGWHATCTAGAPAAAVAAGLSLGLDVEGVARAMALAVPAVPGGLAVKLFPCCYALQRPISAMRALLASEPLPADRVARVVVRTPQAAVQPLIHPRPTSGLQGKFSLEYAVAATLLDGHPGFASFTDEAVERPAARELVERVEVVTSPGGNDLLAGEVRIELLLRDGSTRAARLEAPPGAPEKPPGLEDLHAKFADCGADVPGLLAGLTWPAATDLLREQLPGGSPARRCGVLPAFRDVS
jgi:2-methylcitrate dehydratase PrpD